MGLMKWGNAKVQNLKRRLFVKKFNSVVNNTVNFKLDNSDLLTITILTSHGSVNMAIAQLKSLYRFLETKFPLEIHDDGSLTNTDIALLKQAFVGVEIITRDKADQQIEAYFKEKNYTYLKKFRDKHNINLQCTDLAFFCKTKYCIQIDTDILFFKTPYFLDNDFLTEVIENGKNYSYYNLDRGPAYAYQDDDIKKYLNKDMPFQFNAGICLYPVSRELYYRYAEDILSQSFPIHNNHVENQTVQSMSLQLIGKCIPLKEDVDVALRFLELSNINYNYSVITTQHYCAWSRNLFYLDFIQKIYPFVKKPSSYQQYFYKILKG